MTTLKSCRLCGKVFAVNSTNYCHDCRKKLGELYSSVHEYMRDHDEEEFDIQKLAEGMDVDPAYIKALVDLGYINRVDEDEKRRAQRRKIAAALSKELNIQKDKIVSYGGGIYSRRK